MEREGENKGRKETSTSGRERERTEGRKEGKNSKKQKLRDGLKISPTMHEREKLKREGL